MSKGVGFSTGGGTRAGTTTRSAPIVARHRSDNRAARPPPLENAEEVKNRKNKPTAKIENRKNKPIRGTGE
jgi:hypothetical protein